MVGILLLQHKFITVDLSTQVYLAYGDWVCSNGVYSYFRLENGRNFSSITRFLHSSALASDLDV